MARRRAGDKGGRVPRAADDRNPLETLFFGGSDGLAHCRFAPGILEVGLIRSFGRLQLFAQGGHGFQNRGKNLSRLLPVLDHLFPPAFAVGIAGGRGQGAERIEPDRGSGGGGAGWRSSVWGRVPFDHFLRVSIERQAIKRQAIREWKVHEPRDDLMAEPVPDRLPFRREVGKRVRDRLPGIGGGVDEDGHGRDHGRIGGKAKQVLPFGRALDQQAVGPQVVQGAQQAARRAGTVVSNAEN